MNFAHSLFTTCTGLAMMSLATQAATLTVDPSGGLGFHTTITSAVSSAVPGDTIEIKPGTYTENLTVNFDITLTCSIPTGRVLVDGGGIDRVLNNNSSSVYRNMDFFNGRAWSGAGAQISGDDPEFIQCKFYNNESLDQGGGFYSSTTGTPSFINCEFYNNTAADDGAGGYIRTGDPLFHECKFYGNESSNNGGGVLTCSLGVPRFTKCDFYDNTAANDGAGGCIYAGVSTFEECRFYENDALNHGGGVSSSSLGISKFNHCEFRDNNAAGYGGGVYGTNGIVLVNNCTIEGNFAKDGGGIAITHNGNLEVNTSNILTNSAKNGGGVALEVSSGHTGGNIEFVSVQFDGNEATFGGSVYGWNSNCRLTACDFDNGSATNQGGHLYGSLTHFNVKNSTFNAGSAVNRGGHMLLNDDCTYNGSKNTFTNGRAPAGAMFWVQKTSMTIDESFFVKIISEVDPQMGPHIKDGRAIYIDKSSVKATDSTFRSFVTTDYIALSLIMQRDSHVDYESCVFERCHMVSRPSIVNKPAVIQNEDGKLTMSFCSVTRNNTGKTSNIVTNKSGSLWINDSEFTYNGPSLSGSISRRTKKMSSNGVVRRSGGSIEITDSLFCGNKISHWSGSIMDLGGNTRRLVCP